MFRAGPDAWMKSITLFGMRAFVCALGGTSKGKIVRFGDHERPLSNFRADCPLILFMTVGEVSIVSV